MKFVVLYPDGREIRFEREPMDRERFSSVCGIVYALVASGAFLGFMAIMTSIR